VSGLTMAISGIELDVQRVCAVQISGPSDQACAAQGAHTSVAMPARGDAAKCFPWNVLIDC
jgi:hypothetical protein